MADIIFEPIRFKNLTVKNRVFRSNISGRFDNYDGNQARLNWEVKFAKGGSALSSRRSCRCTCAAASCPTTR